MIQKRNYKLSKIALVFVGIGMFCAPAISRADMIISFEQVGADVKISANGTLNFDNLGTTGPHGTPFATSLNSTEISRVYGLAPEAPGYRVVHAGLAAVTPLSNFGNTTTINGTGTFGWNEFLGDGALLINAADITGGSVGSVSQITWNSASKFFFAENHTLASLGADNLQNTLAFTAYSGDTIRLQTVAVPEPSGAVLLGLSGCCAALVRRRRSRALRAKQTS